MRPVLDTALAHSAETPVSARKLLDGLASAPLSVPPALAAALRAREAQFQALIEHSWDGLNLVGADGTILYASPATTRILGYPVEELTGQCQGELFHPDDRAMAARQFADLLQQPGATDRWQYRLRHQDGTWRWIEGTATNLLQEPRIQAVVLNFRDITERKRTEEELKETVRRLRILVDTARTIDSTLDILLQWLLRRLVADIPAADIGTVYLYDPEAHALLPAGSVQYETAVYSRIRLQPGEGLWGRVFETGCSLLATTSQEMEALDRQLRPENASLLVQALGRRRIVSSICAPLQTHTREIIGTLSLSSTHAPFTEEDLALLEGLAAQAATAIQNTRLFEQVRAGSERLQALSHRLVEIQESERREIARELHDEVGQVLTHLDLMLKLAMRLPPDRIRESLGDAQSLVAELTARVRDLSLDLRPAMLDDLGLLPALLWHLERYTAQTGVRVALKHTGMEQRFPPAIETAAYRIVQEALTNVARHAGVRDVTVRLWAHEKTLSVQIEDRGVGFDPAAALAAGTSSGLIGMRERAILAGGQLVIEAAPGSGARLMAEFPGVIGVPEKPTHDEPYHHPAGG